MSKILLAAGCSYTDNNYLSLDSTAPERGGWKMWPEIVAKELNLVPVNIGVSGSNNDFIFNSIMDIIAIIGDQIDTVAVLWTTADRLPFFYHTLHPFAEMYIQNMNSRSDDLQSWMDNRPGGSIVEEFFRGKNFNLDLMMNHWMKGTLRKMFQLMQICDHMGYKLVMAQGPAYFSEKPFNDTNPPKRITTEMKTSAFMNNSYFTYLEKHRNRIIGWPFLPELGGWDLDLFRSKYQNTTVSEKDFHPNRYGQEIFADLFLNKIKKMK